MRTTILALALTFISLGAIETKAEVSATNTKYNAAYSSRMYAKRSIRNAKISIQRAKRVVNHWSPFRADIAEAIRHQQYAIDLYYWGDYYEAARNSDYAGKIAEYVLFQAYDNGYCSNNDYFGSNNNSGWFWGNNNGWGFGYSQNNNGYGNNGYNNNGNNGWNNGGYDDDLYKKGKDNNASGPRKKGGSENGFDNNEGMNNSGNPRYNGGNNKPSMQPNENSNPRNNKPSFDNSNVSNPRNGGFENGTQQPKVSAPQQGNSQMGKPKMDDAKRSEMKSAFDKMKLDKPDDSKMKMKTKSDDEVLKSEEKLDIDL
jgi:hypothetical protein